jgi:hypothetical protein
MNVIDNKAHNGSARVINVAILMLIIFNSGGITLFEHYYITIATLILLVIKLIVDRRFSFSVFTTAIAFSSVLLLFNLAITNSWSGVNEYMVFMSYILTAAWLLSSYRFSNDSFISDLYLALKIFLYHAVISFLFQFIGKHLLFSLSNRVETFYYLFYYVFEGNSFVARNQGLFWEPGVLQIFLNILIYISLFIRRNYWVASLAALAVLTTFSTTGYLILFILVVTAFLKNMRRSYLAIVGMMILVPIVTVVASINVYEKFEGNSAKSASVRMFDLAVGTALLLDHPLVGVGLDQNSYKETFYSYGIDRAKEYGIADYELEGKGITNSVLFFATAFGLPIAMILMVLLYKQSLLSGSPSLLLAMFFISGFSEPIFNTAFFLLFFISGLLNVVKFNRGKHLCISTGEVGANGQAN